MLQISSKDSSDLRIFLIFPFFRPLQPNGEKLAGAYGSNERYTVMNKLNWLASELHKSYGPLFNPALDDAARAKQREVRWLRGDNAAKIVVTTQVSTSDWCRPVDNAACPGWQRGLHTTRKLACSLGA